MKDLIEEFNVKLVVEVGMSDMLGDIFWLVVGNVLGVLLGDIGVGSFLVLYCEREGYIWLNGLDECGGSENVWFVCFKGVFLLIDLLEFKLLVDYLNLDGLLFVFVFNRLEDSIGFVSFLLFNLGVV